MSFGGLTVTKKNVNVVIGLSNGERFFIVDTYNDVKCLLEEGVDLMTVEILVDENNPFQWVTIDKTEIVSISFNK